MKKKRAIYLSPISFPPEDSGNRRRASDLYSILCDSGIEVSLVFVLFPDFNRQGRIVKDLFSHHGRNAAVIDLSRFSMSRMRPAISRKELFRKSVSMMFRPFHRLGIYSSWIESCPSFRFLPRFMPRLGGNDSYDFAITCYTAFAPLLKNVNAKFKIVDSHDVLLNRNSKMRSQGVRRPWLSTTFEQEKKYISQLSGIIAMTEEDGRFYRRFCEESQLDVDIRVCEVLNAQSALKERVLRHGRVKNELTLGFIGSNNEHNRLAINRFVKQVLPSLHASVLNCRLLIGGGVRVDCSGVSMENSPIVVLGRVANVSSFYSSIDVTINPVTTGSGLSIKSIEAIAAGVPLVASRHALGGIAMDIENNVHEIVDVSQTSQWLDSLMKIVERPNGIPRRVYDRIYEKSIVNLRALIS